MVERSAKRARQVVEKNPEAALTEVSGPVDGETEVSGLVEWGDQGYQID